jgi:hypothetical protein
MNLQKHAPYAQPAKYIEGGIGGISVSLSIKLINTSSISEVSLLLACASNDDDDDDDFISINISINLLISHVNTHNSYSINLFISTHPLLSIIDI